MKKEQEPCIYCGAKTYYGDICPNCYRKRNLIREIQAMIRGKKQELADAQKAPCDFCHYYPPTNEDGKPCSRCPAIPRRNDDGNS